MGFMLFVGQISRMEPFSRSEYLFSSSTPHNFHTWLLNVKSLLLFHKLHNFGRFLNVYLIVVRAFIACATRSLHTFRSIAIRIEKIERTIIDSPESMQNDTTVP